MAQRYYHKGKLILDLSPIDVTPESVELGVKFHDKEGVLQTGTCPVYSGPTSIYVTNTSRVITGEQNEYQLIMDIELNAGDYVGVSKSSPTQETIVSYTDTILNVYSVAKNSTILLDFYTNKNFYVNGELIGSDIKTYSIDIDTDYYIQCEDSINCYIYAQPRFTIGSIIKDDITILPPMTIPLALTPDNTIHSYTNNLGVYSPITLSAGSGDHYPNNYVEKTYFSDISIPVRSFVNLVSSTRNVKDYLLQTPYMNSSHSSCQQIIRLDQTHYIIITDRTDEAYSSNSSSDTVGTCSIYKDLSPISSAYAINYVKDTNFNIYGGTDGITRVLANSMYSEKVYEDTSNIYILCTYSTGTTYGETVGNMIKIDKINWTIITSSCFRIARTYSSSTSYYGAISNFEKVRPMIIARKHDSDTLQITLITHYGTDTTSQAVGNANSSSIITYVDYSLSNNSFTYYSRSVGSSKNYRLYDTSCIKLLDDGTYATYYLAIFAATGWLSSTASNFTLYSLKVTDHAINFSSRASMLSAVPTDILPYVVNYIKTYSNNKVYVASVTNRSPSSSSSAVYNYQGNYTYSAGTTNLTLTVNRELSVGFPGATTGFTEFYYDAGVFTYLINNSPNIDLVVKDASLVDDTNQDTLISNSQLSVKPRLPYILSTYDNKENVAWVDIYDEDTTSVKVIGDINEIILTNDISQGIIGYVKNIINAGGIRDNYIRNGNLTQNDDNWTTSSSYSSSSSWITNYDYLYLKVTSTSSASTMRGWHQSLSPTLSAGSLLYMRATMGSGSNNSAQSYTSLWMTNSSSSTTTSSVNQDYMMTVSEHGKFRTVSNIQRITSSFIPSEVWIGTASRASTSEWLAFYNIIVLDLTASFGAGNEPSKEWCDNNISINSDGTLTVLDRYTYNVVCPE